MKNNEDMVSKLCHIFATVGNIDDMRKLLDDLCTYKEIEQMAQRIAAAKMLTSGSTYKEVIAATNISSATLSRVSRCLKHGSGGYLAVLNVIHDESPTKITVQ